MNNIFIGQIVMRSFLFQSVIVSLWWGTLPAYNQQVSPSPHVRTPGNSLVPGGQEIDVTDYPVTAATKALPARRADGCVWGRKKTGNSKKEKQKPNKNTSIKIKIIFPKHLTVEWTFAHVRTLVSADVGPPVSERLWCIFDYCNAAANLCVAVGERKFQASAFQIIKK